MSKKQLMDGFVGQRMVYVPGAIKNQIILDKKISDLYITHIGFFPQAKGHLRKRPMGCSQYIFIYCKSGKGWIKMENKKHTVVKNEVFIIPPHTPCSYGSDENEPWDNYWIHYTGSNALIYSPDCGTPISINPSKFARIEDRLTLFEEMLQCMEQYSNFDNVVFANITLKYFLSTIRQIDNFRIIGKNADNNSYHAALTYMRNNINSKITLKELSSFCKRSESSIHKLFIKHAHCAPIEYFLQMKMQRACKKLIQSHQKIKQIAQNLGYDDPYYFSRLFTKTIGKSPTQYRRDEQELEL